jgi:cobalt-zinc-cadmium efflux system membrane fusion protein
MSYTSGLLTGVVGTLVAVGAAGAGWWLVVAKPTEAAKPSTPPIPASVYYKEDQSTTVTLKPDAETKLGLQVGEVKRQSAKRSRVYGGEVTIPPGRAVTVAAPLAGVLKPAPGVNLVAGQLVRRGQPVFQLLPLLDPVGRANLIAARVEADGQVQSAAEQLRNANIALERAAKVLKGGAGSQRMVDEAEAQVGVAKKLLEATTARRDLLVKVVGEVADGTGAPVAVEAPADGVVRTVSALPGQTVPAGAALFEVVNTDVVWVRVGVYAGDLTELDPGPATVGPLVGVPGAPGRPGTPVAAPPTAIPQPGTADLFYETPNPHPATAALVGFGFAACDGPRLVPGQRVAVTIPLNDPAESLTVPWPAVVYDFHGGTWVYERTADHTYVRQRVVVRYVRDDLAVLDAGPPAGRKVVTAGAAELFGTEAGFSK